MKLYNLLDILKVPYESTKVHFFLILFHKIIDGLLPSIQLLITANFIDTAIGIVEDNSDYNRIILPILVLILVIAYKWYSDQILKYSEVRMSIAIQENLRLKIIDKRASLKYKYIEDSDTWDLISRVTKEPEVIFKNGFMNILTFFSLIVQVIGVIIIISSNILWAGILILLMNIPLVYYSIISGKVTYQTDRDISKYNRKHTYLRKVLVDRDYASERAIFGFSDKINESWEEQYELSRKLKLKAFLKYFSRMKAGGIFTALVSIIMITVLISPTLNGNLTIGLFMAITSNLLLLVKIGTTKLTLCLNEISRNKEFLNDLNDFILLKEEEGCLEKPLDKTFNIKSITFNNVYFKYPDTDKFILNGVSFNIEYGKHYAFVGENGAGKTTVTKLLTGLYDNYDGEILINDININEYSQSQLKSMISVVYQDFAKYFITFKDNVTLGNINHYDNNDNEFIETIKELNLDNLLKSLEFRENTPLGKIKENATELSNGQWQKIALARSLISSSPLRILDEPTSSLDPITESKLYMEFDKLSKRKTTISISHRLGSAVVADNIFLFDNGQVVESGSHSQLMKLNGKYAKMFESQRSWYL